ncbi:Protein argonaute [Rhodotorula toruloides]
MEALTAEFKSLAVTSLGDPGQTGVVLAQRPDKGGTLGRPIPLVANLYRLKFKKAPSISHYDITFIEVRPEDAPPRRSGNGPPPTINRETSIAIWDALVAMNPDNLGERLRQAAFDCCKNAFTLGRLNIPDGTKTYRIELPAESATRAPRQFDVKLSLAQFLDLSILDTFCQHKHAANLSDLAATAIMALDVLLRHGMYRKQDYVVGGAGRKFLNKRASTPLGQGGELLAGLFQSVRPTVSGMVVNLDSAYSPYIVTGDLLSVCNAIVGRQQTQGGPPQRGGRGGRGGPRGRGGYPAAGRALPANVSDQEIRELKRKLGNSKVRVTHRKDTRPFTIVGFGQPVGRQVVSIGDRSKKGKGGAKPTAKEAAAAAALALPEREKMPQQTMTVADYFAKTYNMININLALPAVELRGGQFVPMEVLELLHGRIIPPTQLTAQQASAMINTAAKPPAERRADIDQIRKQAEFGPGSRPNAWGLDVSVDMMRLQGRLLPPAEGPVPRDFTQGHAERRVRIVEPRREQVSRPRSAARALVCRRLRPRAVRPATRPPELLWHAHPASGFSRLPDQDPCGSAVEGDLLGRSRGPPQYAQARRQPRHAEQPAEQGRSAASAHLLHPPGPEGVRRHQAQECSRASCRCHDAMLPAQEHLQTARRRPVLRQFDAQDQRKARRHQLDRRPEGPFGLIPGKTLLLGADVTHPTGAGTGRAGAEVPPSIAAVVAAVDSSNMKYVAQVREQEGRKEFITELSSMSETLIRTFMKNTKGRPDSIIMFRDGISEGQLAPCVHAEVSQIKAACCKIDVNWNPKLTYIVCAKRHHVRFWAQNERDCDRSENLTPGVVVDPEIVHPYIFEFYLQAHAGLKGTAKPTRYICLLDENGFTSDKIQKLVNSLCYSFARATRSVSLVPVAYYADIVAGKARSFVDTDDASTQRLAQEAKKRDSRYIQDKLDRSTFGQSMWFM